MQNCTEKSGWRSKSLVIAACLMAGLDGIRNQYETPVSMDDGTEKNDTTERLPRTLHEAVKYFKEDEFLQEALGKHISHHLIVTKGCGMG